MHEFIEMSPIHQKIEANFQDFLQDPDYQQGIEKLDRQRSYAEFTSIKENYAAFVNYYVYRRYMKILKVRRGKLAEETEKALVERGYQALDTYRNIVASLERVGEMLYASGVGKAIDRHAASIFQHFNHNPKTPAIIDEFREMGVPEGSISWVFDQMRENNYDILRLEGMEGTFSGLVERASSLVPVLEKSVQIMEEHSLPTIEGAGDDRDEYIEAAVVTAIAIIICLFVCF